MLTIVDALEMFATPKGINLRCDVCGAKFIANPDVGKGGGAVAEAELRRQATAAGWTGQMSRESENDKCAKCSESGEQSDG